MQINWHTVGTATGKTVLDPSTLPKQIRQFNRAFDRERSTLPPDRLKAAHDVKWHLHSLGGVGVRNATIRRGAVESIDNFLRPRVS